MALNRRLLWTLYFIQSNESGVLIVNWLTSPIKGSEGQSRRKESWNSIQELNPFETRKKQNQKPFRIFNPFSPELQKAWTRSTEFPLAKRLERQGKDLNPRNPRIKAFLNHWTKNSKFDYELFNRNSFSIHSWSWNYRGCWHQTCPSIVSRTFVYIVPIPIATTPFGAVWHWYLSSLPRRIGTE